MHIINPLPYRETTVIHSQHTNPGSDCEYKYHNQQILDQIKQAFQKSPNKANLLVGERHIHQGSRGRRTALFPSRKNKGAVPTESRLELAHAIRLECDPTVASYRTQAICIYLPGNQRCYPDFIVWTVYGKYEIHEIKPSVQHLAHDALQKFEQLKSLLQTIEIEFKLFDTNTLPSEKQVDRLLQIYVRGHVHHWTSQQIEMAEKILSNSTCKSLAESHSLLNANDLPTQLFDYFLFHGKISNSVPENDHPGLGA